MARSTSLPSARPTPAAPAAPAPAPWPVWLFAANLIGYARLLLALAAFGSAFAPAGDGAALARFCYLYFASYALDAADGAAARALKQTSAFGAVLDMATDRVCTAGLLALLAHRTAGAAAAGAGRAWVAPMLALPAGGAWEWLYGPEMWL